MQISQINKNCDKIEESLPKPNGTSKIDQVLQRNITKPDKNQNFLQKLEKIGKKWEKIVRKAKKIY